MSTFSVTDLIVNNREFLHPFAVSLTKDSDKSADLVQETIYRALANQEKYNVGTNIKAWLYTIMRNIFINDYRKKSRQGVQVDSEAVSFLMEQSKSVTNDAVSNMGMKEINQAIKNLPIIFKEPFVLFFEGYRYHEIAEILNLPIGTIKSRIHFARKILKKQLERK